jgi:hypothetical protein
LVGSCRFSTCSSSSDHEAALEGRLAMTKDMT